MASNNTDASHRQRLIRRTSSFENLQQAQAAAAATAAAAAAMAAASDDTVALLPPTVTARRPGPAAAAVGDAGQQQAASCFPRRRLLRRNSSTPCFSGNYSKVAHKLGKYVDDCLFRAFQQQANNEADKGREQCVNHVVEVLQAEILQPVLKDLQAYRADLNFEQFDFSNARLILSNLEYRVATVRDRLLYPFHYQQVMDLSHLCGCIHSVRMRLGFVASRVEPAAVSVV